MLEDTAGNFITWLYYKHPWWYKTLFRADAKEQAVYDLCVNIKDGFSRRGIKNTVEYTDNNQLRVFIQDSNLFDRDTEDWFIEITIGLYDLYKSTFWWTAEVIFDGGSIDFKHQTSKIQSTYYNEFNTVLQMIVNTAWYELYPPAGTLRKGRLNF